VEGFGVRTFPALGKGKGPTNQEDKRQKAQPHEPKDSPRRDLIEAPKKQMPTVAGIANDPIKHEETKAKEEDG